MKTWVYYKAFNNINKLVYSGVVEEHDRHQTDYLTLAGVIEELTAIGLTRAITNIQLQSIRTGEVNLRLDAEAVRSLPNSAGQYTWMVEDFGVNVKQYEPDADLPDDEPLEV